jgi:hypothetical protein
VSVDDAILTRGTGAVLIAALQLLMRFFINHSIFSLNID